MYKYELDNLLGDHCWESFQKSWWWNWCICKAVWATNPFLWSWRLEKRCMGKECWRKGKIQGFRKRTREVGSQCHVSVAKGRNDVHHMAEETRGVKDPGYGVFQGAMRRQEGDKHKLIITQKSHMPQIREGKGALTWARYPTGEHTYNKLSWFRQRPQQCLQLSKYTLGMKWPGELITLEIPGLVNSFVLD